MKKYLTPLAWVFILFAGYSYFKAEYSLYLTKLYSTLGILCLAMTCMSLKGYLSSKVKSELNIEDHLVE